MQGKKEKLKDLEKHKEVQIEEAKREQIRANKDST